MTEKNCGPLGREPRIDENIILNTPEMTEVIPVFVTFSKNVSAEVSYRMPPVKGNTDAFSRTPPPTFLFLHIQLSKNRNT